MNLLNNGDVVYDMFAGIGPFSIPAAKQKCLVLANDLNPESYKWLNSNIKLNKVKQEMETYNLDGRQFVHDIVKPHLLSTWSSNWEETNNIHIIMNLPALAIEFLDVFPNLFHESELDDVKEFVAPIVHCYTFSKDINPQEDARQRVEERLGFPVADYNIRLVRNVAPNKEMLYISFPLTRQILCGNTAGVKLKESVLQENETNEPINKRPKKDNCL